MSIRRILPAVFIAGALAFGFSAKGQINETTAERAGPQVMRFCADFWETKDQEALEEKSKLFKESFKAIAEKAQSDYDKLKKEYEEAIEKVEVQKAKATANLLGEATADNTVKADGLISKAGVASLVLGKSGAKAQEKLRVAEDRRDFVKGMMKEAGRRLVAVYVVGVTVNDCAKDQFQYLNKLNTAPEPPPRQTAAVAPPPPNLAGMQEVRGVFTSAWSGSCRQGQQVIPMQGRIVMNLTGDANVGTSFTVGAPPAIRGTVSPEGRTSAKGVASFGPGLSMPVTLTGTVTKDDKGVLVGSGLFAAEGPQGIQCTGRWGQ